jgi:hypothetical protein
MLFTPYIRSAQRCSRAWSTQPTALHVTREVWMTCLQRWRRRGATARMPSSTTAACSCGTCSCTGAPAASPGCLDAAATAWCVLCHGSLCHVLALHMRFGNFELDG